MKKVKRLFSVFLANLIGFIFIVLFQTNPPEDTDGFIGILFFIIIIVIIGVIALFLLK